MRLSNQTAARVTLPAGKSELIVFDDALPGFGLRVRTGGARTWIAQYRVGRKQRRVSLGAVGTVEAEQARKAAKTILAQVQLGADPQAERAAEKGRAEVTLQTATALYLGGLESGRIGVGRNNRRMRAGVLAGVKRHFEKHWAPLAADPLHKIDRARVAVRLTEIADEAREAAEKTAKAKGKTVRPNAGAVAANRARSSLSAFFGWAMGEGIAEFNPVIATNKFGEEPRKRVLTDAELVAVWNGCHDDDYGRIVRLLILTGQRREEVGGLRESEIDRDRRLWQLPSERTKNGLAHDVPLSDAGLAVIPARLSRGLRDLFFGEAEASPFSGWSRCKARLDDRCGVVDWTLHDLRRTVATGMNEIGIVPHVVEAALNHVSGARRGVAGIYNRALYATEKRQAFDRWAAHVEALVAGHASNIVAMGGR